MNAYIFVFMDYILRLAYIVLYILPLFTLTDTSAIRLTLIQPFPANLLVSSFHYIMRKPACTHHISLHVLSTQSVQIKELFHTFHATTVAKRNDTSLFPGLVL